jgi:23S rRNA G2445 N2-methylase RlmL
MSYRMVPDRVDHSDLAQSHVLRSAPGYPAFPVAEELFLRAARHLPERPLQVWDPCCGSGYELAVVALQHRAEIGSVLASDVSPEAVALATANLRLLSAAGLQERREELLRRAKDFAKPAYRGAAAAAERLAVRLAAAGGDLPSRSGVADALSVDALREILQDTRPDLVLTDVPYGERTEWQAPASCRDPLPTFLGTLAEVLPESSVIAVTAKMRKIPLEAGTPVLERLRVGKRAAVLGRAGQLRSAA